MEECIYDRQIYKQQHAEMVLEGTAQPRIFEGACATAWLRNGKAAAWRAATPRCSSAGQCPRAAEGAGQEGRALAPV